MAITPVNFAQLASNPNASTAVATPAPSLGSKLLSAAGAAGSLFTNYGKAVIGGVKSGYNQIQTAQNNSANGQENPLLAGTEEAGGIGGILSAPFTAGFQPAGDALQQSVSTAPITDNPGYQKFAMGTGGKIVATTATVAGNLASAAGGVLGATDIAGGANAVKAGEGSNVWEKAYSQENAVSPRTADATPAYSKELVGQNVKNTEGNIVPRINEGEGLTGQRTVTTSAGEAESGKELANLKNYPDKGTALQKAQAVGKGISQEAENMRAGLKAEDTSHPLDVQSQKAKVSDTILKSLPEDIQEKIGVNTPEENAMLKGMSEKAGAPVPEGGKYDLRQPGDIPALPKTASGRYYAKVLDALNSYDGTREGLLNLRQTVDSAFKSEGGKYAYGSDSQNALQEVHTDIRDAINQELGNTTENTDTQASLKKQTNLYRAQDVLNEKAKVEATSQIGRFFQNHPILHRLATREFMRTATQLVTAGAGIGILTKLITDTLKGK